MSENVQPPLSGVRAQAALLIAADELTDAAIAAACGYRSAKTIQRMRNDPAIAARVDEHRAEFAAAIRGRGIADVQNRVDAANDRWLRMRRLVDARAEQYREIPGGDTGLLVATPLLVKVYATRPTVTPATDGPPIIGETLEPQKQAEIVYEYAFDRALLAELRAHEEHVAKQLNELVERKELTGKNGEPLASASIVYVLPEKDAPPDPGAPPDAE